MWIAKYSDGNILPQFGEDDRENKFSDINQELLEEFIISIDKKVYSMNVKLGEVNLNGCKVSFSESKKSLHRLIYFRRVKQMLGTFGGKSGTEIDEHFGFQTNVKGENIKRIFVIKNDGTLIQE